GSPPGPARECLISLWISPVLWLFSDMLRRTIPTTSHVRRKGRDSNAATYSFRRDAPGRVGAASVLRARGLDRDGVRHRARNRADRCPLACRRRIAAGARWAARDHDRADIREPGARAPRRYGRRPLRPARRRG